MASPTTVAPTTTAFTASTVNHNVAMPATVNAGELLLLFFQENGTSAVTTPSGWSIVVARFGGSIIYGKVAAGTEGGGGVNVITGSAETAVAHVYVVAGWGGSLTNDIAAPTTATATSTNPDPPSASWTWGTVDILIITSAGYPANGSASAAPTNYTNLTSTNVASSGEEVSINTARRSRTAAASPENPGVFTFGTSTTWRANTVVVNGIPPATGTIAATLRKATFSATGVMQTSGTVAATLRKALFSGTGAQTQTGTVAATMRKATASLTGVMQPSGTVTATLRKATFSATGVMQPSGSIAATLRKATASLTGVMQPSGAVTATLVEPTAAFLGTQAQIGAVAATLTEPTAAFLGTQAQIGTVAATLRRPLFAGSALLTRIGYALLTDSRIGAGLPSDALAYGATLTDSRIGEGTISDG